RFPPLERAQKKSRRFADNSSFLLSSDPQCEIHVLHARKRGIFPEISPWMTGAISPKNAKKILKRLKSGAKFGHQTN
ncbi:MAG: hypothetical protein ACRD25_00850, partial [Terracidiphilus sp.]